MASDEKKILLVEDEKAIRDAVAAYLEREGYIVRGVGDGQSAVEEFEKHSFDLVILDLMLPKLSGERVCRAIRETSNVPIIMLTAKGEVEDRIIGLELGADDEHIETVAAEVRRLSRLVDAMLKLSRLENGSTELKTERTDVVYLIRSLVTSQHQLFHEKGLHLRFVDESQYGELNADIDPDLIREAVVNLMSNAMRYTDEDGWVTVTVRQDKSDVLIAVQDTGIGIAKEDIPQTFSRFWRSDVSRERVSGGLGVGLSLTKEIVDKHNGTILVESELGKGTTFTLRIPQNRGRRNLAQAIQEG